MPFLRFCRKPECKVRMIAAALLLILWAIIARPLAAQDNYEIQVYGSETVAPKNTMVELHSNFTVDGSKPLPGSRYAADGTF
ncbi:MAG: hypothetical protein IRZ03_13335, partial [Acidobacterium ailaaui]|nr:hypothetical protein [Pseudacidobacterium ailaaui]